MLTDNSRIYISKEFNDFINKDHQIQLIHSSPYYPQGNGINESSHKTFEGIIKTMSEMEKYTSYREIVDTAVLAYNNTPHGSLGDSPFFHVFGVDCILPGFSDLTAQYAMDLRLLYLKERWTEFNNNQECKEIKKQNLETEEMFKVGDLVTYELPEILRKKFQHYSKCKQYCPYWSLPYRILKVGKEFIEVVPICYNGKVERLPLAKVKILRNQDGETYIKQLEDFVSFPNNAKRNLPIKDTKMEVLAKRPRNQQILFTEEEGDLVEGVAQLMTI